MKRAIPVLPVTLPLKKRCMRRQGDSGGVDGLPDKYRDDEAGEAPGSCFVPGKVVLSDAGKPVGVWHGVHFHKTCVLPCIVKHQKP